MNRERQEKLARIISRVGRVGLDSVVLVHVVLDLHDDSGKAADPLLTVTAEILSAIAEEDADARIRQIIPG